MGISRKTKEKLLPLRVFSWSGDPIPGKHKRINTTYYRGFQLDNMKIEVGDCVSVSASATLSMSDYYVGRIKECYDNGAETDSHWADIQWYSQIEELPRNHKKYLPKDYPEFDATMELLKDLTPFNNTDIDSIVGKCQVTEVESSIAAVSVERPHPHTEPFFVCRFLYQRKMPYIMPIIDMPKNMRSLKCFLNTGSTLALKMPVKLPPSNKENMKSKKSRRKTKVLNDMSILKEINEENSNNMKQPLQEVKTLIDEEMKLFNPKPLIVEPNMSGSITPKKATPITKGRQSSVAKACLFDLPKRDIPIKKNGTNFEIARSQLHVSTVPTCLPCREDEFQQIYSFVEGKLLDSIGGCLYISGVPGTGKTATVNEVMNLLKEAQTDGSIPAFDLLHINAMKLTQPHQLWVQMWKEISGEKVTSDHAAKLLARHLTKSAPKRKCITLILDELDLLWTRKQDVMYNLFDWSAQVCSKLIVVAIANTMDLPERMMISRVSSRLGLTRMTFQPYTFNQLQKIIKARLSGIKAFEPDAIQFVSRKVGALSGDARRALDICRRAIEIAEQTSMEPGKKVKYSPSKFAKCRQEVVGMEHVSKAIVEMFASSMIKAISRCSKVEKIILQCIIIEFTRTGLEEAIFEKVLILVVSTCRFEGMRPLPTSSQVMALLQCLSSQRIILAEHSRFDLMMRIRLNVSIDDINFAIHEKTNRT